MNAKAKQVLAFSLIALSALVIVFIVVRGAPPVVKNSERWLGLFPIVIGLYLFVCATWARSFVLYRLKVARAIRWFGEGVTHTCYQLIGIAAFTAGILVVIGRL